ncbi:MAG TPA: PQQ-dependent sugar dehydrogenase [Vicinamibacterales bacterium]|jgi:glucose/arabinose dehydrogenase
MISNRLALGATVLLTASIGLHARQQPQPPAMPPAGPPTVGMPPQGTPGAPQRAGAPGRGGGRGNPMAAKFTETCLACHGNSTAKGPVGPSLFDEEWIHGGDDDAIVKSIKEGYPDKGMPSFVGQMTDPEIWQMVAYIRTQAANLKDKPVYVPDPDGQIIKSEKQAFKVEIIARNLETPWALAFLPDGRLLISERPGRIRIVDKDGKMEPEGVKGLPKVWEKQDGGLFDIEVHPDYAKAGNGWIYISYSETLAGWTPPPPPDPNAAPPAPAPGQGGRGRGPSNDPPSMTVIMRGRLNASNEFVDQQVLFRAPKELYSQTNAHYGSRFLFDKQNHLFFSLGEKMQMANAQDLSVATGKIHRINDDGTVPKDNPYVGQPNVVQSIWSYGHRNPQGLAWDPVTGQLWESEHGPTGGDEINIIEPKHNYGWGVATKGVQPGITKTSEPGMDDPIRYWTPSVAPSGIVFYTGTKYPGWKNDLFVSCLAGQQLKRLEIKDGKVLHEEQVFNTFGRVHDVIQGPDGLLYVTLQLPGQVLSASTPGMVARLVPVKP